MISKKTIGWISVLLSFSMSAMENHLIPLAYQRLSLAHTLDPYTNKQQTESPDEEISTYTCQPNAMPSAHAVHECPICYEDLIVKGSPVPQCAPTQWLSCNHTHEYHTHCLENELRRSGHCPSCKSVTLHRAFLSEDFFNQYGRTIFEAIAHDDLPMVRFFIETQPASLNALQENTHQTPLIKGASESNFPLIELLLENNAAVNRQDHEGKTALMHLIIAGESKQDSHSTLKLAAMERLIAQGALIDIHCFAGKNAFLYAVQTGNIQLIEWCIRQGSILNSHDHQGNNALSLAIQQGNNSLIYRLIDLGCRITISDIMRNAFSLFNPPHPHRPFFHRLVAWSILIKTKMINDTRMSKNWLNRLIQKGYAHIGNTFSYLFS